MQIIGKQISQTSLHNVGGFTFPEANGQCVGGKGESEQNDEFSRNEGGQSGCVVGSSHNSVQLVIIFGVGTWRGRPSQFSGLVN